MSSLPDQFDEDQSDNPVEELPTHEDHRASFAATTNIEKGRTEKNKKNEKMFFSGALIVALFSVVLNGVVYSVAVENPLDRVVAFLSGRTMSKTAVLDKQQKLIHELQTVLLQHNAEFRSIATFMASQNDRMMGMKNELMISQSQEAQWHHNIQTLSADVELLKKPKPLPKPVVVMKPKVPVAPPVLIFLRSLRVEGELAWVSLREGVEISPLLTIGDEWHGCKIVSVELLKKEAQLLVSGATIRVTL